MRTLHILAREEAVYEVALEDDGPWFYSLGETIVIDGHGTFLVQYATGFGSVEARMQRLTLAAWEGDEIWPEPGSVVTYTVIPPVVPTCCELGQYHTWRFRGRSDGRWVGPEENGWSQGAGTTGYGCIWTVTHCSGCGAPMPGPPPHLRIEARSQLLGLLRLRPESDK